VLEGAGDRNKKSSLGCEEAVEDRDSLWKAKEKTREILRHGRTRHEQAAGRGVARIRRKPRFA
jgi:hypothetical protein